VPLENVDKSPIVELWSENTQLVYHNLFDNLKNGNDKWIERYNEFENLVDQKALPENEAHGLRAILLQGCDVSRIFDAYAEVDSEHKGADRLARGLSQFYKNKAEIKAEA
jgi:hypothetical protein